MADVAAVYTLTTGAGTITFNSGTNQYFINEIRGLEGAPIRAPVDPRPLTDGGLVYTFFKGPRHVVFEGFFHITSTRVQNSVLTLRNSMESSLRIALDSILAADGTLSWTPYGGSAESLTVRYEVPLECAHAENYLQRTFTFGLIAANPDF